MGSCWPQWLRLSHWNFCSSVWKSQFEDTTVASMGVTHLFEGVVLRFWHIVYLGFLLQGKTYEPVLAVHATFVLKFRMLISSSMVGNFPGAGIYVQLCLWLRVTNWIVDLDIKISAAHFTWQVRLGTWLSGLNAPRFRRRLVFLLPVGYGRRFFFMKDILFFFASFTLCVGVCVGGAHSWRLVVVLFQRPCSFIYTSMVHE